MTPQAYDDESGKAALSLLYTRGKAFDSLQTAIEHGAEINVSCGCG